MTIKTPTTDIASFNEARPKRTEKFNPTDQSIKQYISAHHLKGGYNKANKKKATIALRKQYDKKNAPIGTDVSGSDPVAEWQIIYGTVRVGGIHTFVHTINRNQYLLFLFTIAGHEINAVTKILFDGVQVTFSSFPGTSTGPTTPVDYSGDVYAQIAFGTTGQSALSQLLADAPDKWTSAHKQSNRAGVYLKLKWDSLTFANNVPEVTFEVQGKKLFDPRSSTTAFSANAALVLYDFLTDANYGLGVPTSEIHTQSFKDAADVCDESVSLAGGGSEARYTVNGSFTVSQSPAQTIQNILGAMGAYLTYTSGQFKVWPAKYRSPTITLDENDCLGQLRVTNKLPKSETFNGIKGTYTSPNDDWQATDFPAVLNSTYKTQDSSIPLYEDITLAFTTSSASAQRLAKIELERVRQSITVEGLFSLRAYQLECGDTVSLSNTRMGWSPKIFEVQLVELVFQNGGNGAPTAAVQLLLRETASGVFDWNSGMETTVDLAPDTNLPNPYSVDAITHLVPASGTSIYYVNGDGSVVFPVKLTWDAMTDFFVSSGGHIEVQYKFTVDSLWTNSFNVPGDQISTLLFNLQTRTHYDFRVRAVNGIGAVSSWTEVDNFFVLGKDQPPSDVSAFVGTISDLGINFRWDAVTDIDIGGYEIREGTVWASAIVIGSMKSSDGNTFLYQELTAGTHNFLIKAIDTSGNYSTNPTAEVVVIVGPQVIQNFEISTIKNNVLLDWDDPIPSSLSVNQYLVYKGADTDTFGTATLIGTMFGTFETYLEKYGGTFNYWIVAVDVGGNQSTPVQSSITITPSEDFFIHADQFLYPSLNSTSHCVLDNALEAIYALIGGETVGTSLPIIAGQSYVQETFAQHFSNHSWTNIQDAITAGYTYWLEPVSTSFTANVEFLVDYVVTFSSVFVDFSWLETVLDGTLTVVPTISVSLDGLAWTDYASTKQVFASNFRYVKYKLAISGATDKCVSKFTAFRAVLSVQRTEETQIITANSGDSGGTTVTFENTFLDVEDIQVTCNNTVHRVAIYNYNFANVPADQTMKVLVFDSSGARATSQVTCRIRGAIGG